MPINLSLGILLPVFIALTLIFLVIYLLIKISDRYSLNLSKRLRKYRFTSVLSVLILLFLLLLLAPIILIPVGSGHVGVLWQRFMGGTKLGPPLAEGTVLVMPWDHLTIYSTRFQVVEEPVQAVTSEGLSITLNIVVRYRPVRNTLTCLHKLVGEGYPKRLIIPEMGSSSRLVVSSYTAEETYSNKRKAIQEEIFNRAKSELNLNINRMISEENISKCQKSEYIHLEDILIRTVELPEKINLAIISKVNQKYLDQEYETRLDVAEKEAERKKIEAGGIADFQEIVVGGISETYLRWRGIEATVELAKSNNTKVVVIGGGSDGLPLILNTEGDSLPVQGKEPTIDNEGTPKSVVPKLTDPET